MENDRMADFDAAKSIRALMEMHNLSEFRFSEITGLSQSSVSGVEELQPFLDEVLPGHEEEIDTSSEEFLIDPDEFIGKTRI